MIEIDPIYFFLRSCFDRDPRTKDIRLKKRGSAYDNVSKLDVLLGEEFWDAIKGKTVIDFGSGEGDGTIEIASRGARQAIGLEIQEDCLEDSRKKAERAGLAETCTFAKSTEIKADLILSVDAFEHFADPAGVLRNMYDLLADGGEAWIVFGPLWKHPLGGHEFSPFPWAHLLLPERSLIKWRDYYNNDGVTCFEGISGGLNRMTIERTTKLFKESPFNVESMELVPIRKARYFHNKYTREYLTSMAKCRLRKINSAVG